MGRIQNAWKLSKTSWRVLRKDRELLVIPILSFVAMAGALIFTGVMALLVSSLSGSEESGGGAVGPAMLVLFVLCALVIGVIAVFFEGALVAGAHERLTGGDPTVGSAIGKAFERIGGLVPWALITTTVGLILRALRDRAGWLGHMLVAVIDTAWDVVTFLTVPAIVVDDLGAIEALKRSSSLLRTTWGENLAARVGFGLLGFVLVIPAVIIEVIAIASGATALILVASVLAAGWIAVVVVVMTALNAIFQTALYLYATTGRMPDGFENAPLTEAFTNK